MKLNVYTLYDRQTDMHGNPMFMISDGQCLRAMSDEVNRADPQNQLYTHPGDFQLFFVGTFDQRTGTFDQDDRRLVANADQLTTKQPV